MSPASLDILLRMVACGAEGPTLDQLLSFLGAQDIEDLNSKASATMEALCQAVPPKNERESEAPIINGANAVWVDQKYLLSESFKKIVIDVYRADTNAADFQFKPGKAVKKINAWAKESTKGCIGDIVNSKDITPATMIVLANALYFKGQFPTYLFPRSHTSDDVFHLLNGTNKVTVPFMNNLELNLHFASFDDFKVLELPYESLISLGDQKYLKCSMYIFLPRERNGLPHMLRKHFGSSNPGEAFLQTLGKLERQYMGKVHIPKWKFSFRCEPKETMQKLGLTLPFEFKRDFAKMFCQRLDEIPPMAVSKMIQSVSIQMDETGTVAAAVTISTEVQKSRRCPHKKRRPTDDFIAEHPFMFLITEKRSKTVIFAGSVVNPLT